MAIWNMFWNASNGKFQNVYILKRLMRIALRPTRRVGRQHVTGWPLSSPMPKVSTPKRAATVASI